MAAVAAIAAIAEDMDMVEVIHQAAIRLHLALQQKSLRY